MKTEVVCLLAGLTLMPAVAAAQVTVLRPAPQSVIDTVRQELLIQHGRLTSARDAVLRAAADLVRDCTDVPETSASIGPCRQRQGRIDTRRVAYNSDADGYNARVVFELDKRIADMRAAIAADQGAIRNLGIARGAEAEALGSYAAAVNQEWIDQRDAAFKNAAMAFAGFAIQTARTRGLQTSSAKAAIAGFRKADADRLTNGLREAGINEPEIADSLQALATATDTEKGKAVENLLDRLRKARTVWDLKDLLPHGESAKWLAGNAILTVFVPDPRMKLLGKLTLAEVRATFYAINANIELRLINGQIDRLSALTDQQLGILKVLSARLSANVDRLNAAKAERAALV
jgi:hypothetical protein